MALGKKLSPLLLGLVLLVGLLAFLNWPQEQAGQTMTKKLTPVKVYEVSNKLFPVTIDALGTATANESVTLTAQVADTVTRVLFDDGDNVWCIIISFTSFKCPISQAIISADLEKV